MIRHFPITRFQDVISFSRTAVCRDLLLEQLHLTIDAKY